MKAIINTQYGPPEIVKLMDIPIPTPKPGEVLIRVKASTVNRTDCGFRSAEYFISRFFSGLFRPKNKTLGNEFAGIIEALGAGVTNYKIGDQVFGYNDKTFGAHAEFMTMDALGSMALMPTGWTFEDAAALTEGSHYALCDIHAAKVQAGQNILVYGATGAIGSAAVQLLKHFGTHVTAICSTPYMDLVKSLGADRVIDYTKEDYSNSEQRYDFIFDAVGKSSFGQAKKVLTENGIYISTELGKNSENVFLAMIAKYKKKKVLFPIPSINKSDVDFLQSLAIAGKFKPVIDRSYTLEQMVEAYRYVESGQKIGNVIIKS